MLFKNEIFKSLILNFNPDDLNLVNKNQILVYPKLDFSNNAIHNKTRKYESHKTSFSNYHFSWM